jgi:ABC-type uncharacterized transport system substrate-binding protein
VLLFSNISICVRLFFLAYDEYKRGELFMRKCVIFILTLREVVEHTFYAAQVVEALAAIKTTTEEYVTYILECDENPESFQKAIMEHPNGPCDLLISTGLTITQMLPDIYKKTGDIQALFFGVTAAVELGIADSLERIGHPYSGVAVAGSSAENHVEQLKIILPYASHIFIPYMPESFGGYVRNYAVRISAALEMAGFAVVLKPVATPQEGLDAVAETISTVDAVLLLESCDLSDEISAYVSYTCAAAGRMFISSNGYNGMRAYGAPVAYGANEGFSLMPELVAMVQRFWRDGQRMETQPVVMLSDVRRLHVNMFGLPWLPPEVIEAIQNDPAIEKYRIWVDSPLTTDPDDGSSVSVQ